MIQMGGLLLQVKQVQIKAIPAHLMDPKINQWD